MKYCYCVKYIFSQARSNWVAYSNSDKTKNLSHIIDFFNSFDINQFIKKRPMSHIAHLNNCSVIF